MAIFRTPMEFTSARTPAGQSMTSWLMRTTAPASSRSSTLSFIQKGPLTCSPGGTYATPPPFAAHASIAA